jgi:hypothetical protein
MMACSCALHIFAEPSSDDWTNRNCSPSTSTPVIAFPNILRGFGGGKRWHAVVRDIPTIAYTGRKPVLSWDTIDN